MSSRKLCASPLIACLVAIGFLAIAPAANAASARLSVLKAGNSATKDVIEINYRGRGKPLFLPIAPNYLAYDYPYYYRRGFYPRYIGPGYIYYGYPYFYRKRYSSRCSYWQHRRCIASLRHKRGARRQREACRCH